MARSQVAPQKENIVAKNEAAAAEASPPPKRYTPPQLWDDMAFRTRLNDLAAQKGRTVKEVMEELGLTREYAYRGSDARSTNLIMVFADYFGITPAEMAGWDKPANGKSQPAANGQRDVASRSSAEATHLIEKLAEIFSEQTLKMLLITLAVTRPDADLKALVQSDLAFWKDMFDKKREKPRPAGAPHD